MKNILSIDTESWIHFYEDALKIRKHSSHGRKKLDNNYVKEAIRGMLDILDIYNQKATFFIVSEIYDWHPSAVEEIKNRGHEIAHHTHTHPLLKDKDILKKELSLSRDFIKKFNPLGFRAPQIYLTEDAFPFLEDYGFRYSSSSYDDYIISKHGKIKEIPVSSISFFKKEFSKKLPKNLSLSLLLQKIPFGSGLFIALLGSKISFFISKLNKRGIPAIIFIHPWQIYNDRRINSLSFRLKLLFRNPLCLPYTINIMSSMEKLFKKHQFTSFQEYFYGQQ